MHCLSADLCEAHKLELSYGRLVRVPVETREHTTRMCGCGPTDRSFNAGSTYLEFLTLPSTTDPTKNFTQTENVIYM